MTIDPGREVNHLIATRNRPMLTALDLCIEQLERLGKDRSGLTRFFVQLLLRPPNGGSVHPTVGSTPCGFAQSSC